MRLCLLLLGMLVVGSAPAAEISLWGERWYTYGSVCAEGETATIKDVGGAHRLFKPVAGRIRVSAEFDARGCGFAGLAVGRGNLSGNIWSNSRVILFAAKGGVALQVGGKDWTSKLKVRNYRPGDWVRLELDFDTVASVLTVSVDGKRAAEGLPLPPAVGCAELDAAGFRFNEPVQSGVPKVRAFTLETENLYTAGLQPVRAEQYFVDPDVPVKLQWKAASRGKSPQVPFELLDYEGRVTAKLLATCAEDGVVTVTTTFPRGYHEIRFPEAKQTLGVLALPAVKGERDPFFCMDGALTWNECDPAKRERLVAAMARTGISRVRERLALGNFNAERGWEHWRHPRELRDLYARYGLKTLEMQWGATPGMDATPGRRIALDGPGLRSAWIETRRRLDVCWSGYEIGNEADLEDFPADQYVSSVKAGVLAQDPGKPRLPVAAGVFASLPPGDWYDCAARNGLAQAVDAVTFHQYDRVASVEGQVAAMRKWLSDAREPNRTILLTESGHSWPMGPDRPTVTQDIESAGEISAKAIEAKACGVSEFHPFVVSFYEEGGTKNFGMFGREASPLRQYAAYAFCIRTLGRSEYIGDLVGSEAVRARVFKRPDNSRVVAFYTLKPRTPLRVPGRPREVCGADGRRLSPNADGRYAANDLLLYAVYDTLADGLVKTGTEALRLKALADSAHASAPSVSPVVLRYLWPKDIRRSKRAYFLSKDEARDFTLAVELQNVSERPQEVGPALRLPDGRRLSGGRVQVPPLSRKTVSWRADVLSALDVLTVRYLEVTAACTDADDALPLAIPVLVDGELDEVLARFDTREPLPIAETGRWLMRTGSGRHSVTAKDGGIAMDLHFGQGGAAWVYPYFRLPHPIDPSRHEGVVIRARIRRPATMVSLLLADERQNYEVWAADLFAPDGEWHSVYVPFEGLHYRTAGMQNAPLDFTGISSLSVGCCSRELENGLEVGNMILVGRRKKEGK